MNHLTAKAQKSRGAHYTPPELAQFLARQVVAAWFADRTVEHKAKIDILDPAVGGGELLEAILSEVPTKTHHFVSIRGMDSDPVAVTNARRRLGSLSSKVEIVEGDFLDKLTGVEPDFFTEVDSAELADIVIANPPYVRTQVLGSHKAQALAQKFSLRGRVDLSFPFVLGIIEILRSGGVAGIITSNRFLSTRAGSSLRSRLRDTVDVLHIWDLGDTRLFDAAVLPCVLLIKKISPKKKTLFTSVYSVSSKEKRAEPIKLFSFLSTNSEGVIDLGSSESRYEVKRGILQISKNGGDVWKLRNRKSNLWTQTVTASTWKRIGDITKVRVGVKTTSDSVFIRKDWNSECCNCLPETLKPIITHHLANRFRGLDPVNKILYTHETRNGRKQALELKNVPNAARYLEKYRQKLEDRKYVTDAGREWFEIWVPQDPESWEFPKIVFKDIAEKPTFWLDLDGNVVNGDCYWFTLGEELTDIYWLTLGVFNSHFIENFYDSHFANKLYSGRRRFMTQYVSEFPLPNPKSDVASKIVGISKELYAAPDLEQSLIADLNRLVVESFGLPVEEV